MKNVSILITARTTENLRDVKAFVKEALTQEVRQRIENGDSFDLVVEQVSTDVTSTEKTFRPLGALGSDGG